MALFRPAHVASERFPVARVLSARSETTSIVFADGHRSASVEDANKHALSMLRLDESDVLEWRGGWSPWRVPLLTGKLQHVSKVQHELHPSAKEWLRLTADVPPPPRHSWCTAHPRGRRRAADAADAEPPLERRKRARETVDASDPGPSSSDPVPPASQWTADTLTRLLRQTDEPPRLIRTRRAEVDDRFCDCVFEHPTELVRVEVRVPTTLIRFVPAYQTTVHRSLGVDNRGIVSIK